MGWVEDRISALLQNGDTVYTEGHKNIGKIVFNGAHYSVYIKTEETETDRLRRQRDTLLEIAESFEPWAIAVGNIEEQRDGDRLAKIRDEIAEEQQ